MEFWGLQWLCTRASIFGLLSDILPLSVAGSKQLVKLLRCFLSCTSPTVEVSFCAKGGVIDALLVGSV